MLATSTVKADAGSNYDSYDTGGFSSCLWDCLQKCERLTLLILSNVLSAPFQEPVSPLVSPFTPHSLDTAQNKPDVFNKKPCRNKTVFFFLL